jgi:hypothetical protein
MGVVWVNGLGLWFLWVWVFVGGLGRMFEWFVRCFYDVWVVVRLCMFVE